MRIQRKDAKTQRRNKEGDSSFLGVFASWRLGVKEKGSGAMRENEIAKTIVDAAIEVHRELGGPGLLEDVYEESLAEELRLRGLKVERQLPVRINYKGRILSKPLRLDMKAEGLVLVDNKAVTEWNPIFEAQMLTYLRLTGLKLGLVINFGEQFVKNGIHRVVNGLPDDLDFRRQPKHKDDSDNN